MGVSTWPCGSQAGGAWKGGSWGTQRAGGLTEAQIREELQNNGPDEIPYAVRNASNTVAWWRQRQAVIDLKVCIITQTCFPRVSIIMYFAGTHDRFTALHLAQKIGAQRGSV